MENINALKTKAKKMRRDIQLVNKCSNVFVTSGKEKKKKVLYIYFHY